MTNSNIIFIGLDTAKEYSEVAYVADGYDQKPVPVKNGTDLFNGSKGLIFLYPTNNLSPLRPS